MPDKPTPQTQFPSGIAVPDKLQTLLKAVAEDIFEPYDLGNDFHFDFESTTDWFASPTPSALYAASQLAAFGCSADGSIYALWHAPTGGFPVVYLGSEGDAYALASDFDQFLRLVATADWADDEERDPAFLDWVRAQGLGIPESGDTITDAAALAYPDFSGWCDEVREGTLSAATATPPPPPVFEAADQVPAHADLWTLLVAAIGQRIDSPVVQALLDKIGAKPLKPGTPRDFIGSYTGAKAFGIEIMATCNPTYRAYWPARKEGRVWVTYVTKIMLEPPYPGPLPAGLDWTMEETALDALGPKEWRGFDDAKDPYWTLPAPRDDVTFEATSAHDRLFGRLWLSLIEERDYITASAEYEKSKPLVYVEDAFFAAWCALHGLLRTDKFTTELLKPLYERRMTPLQFLHGPCGRLLWSGDLAGKCSFLSDYYLGLHTPDAKRWVTDIKKAFGTANHFRDKDQAMTEDSWENFDRIAPFIEKRYREWQQGKLKSEV